MWSPLAPRSVLLLIGQRREEEEGVGNSCVCDVCDAGLQAKKGGLEDAQGLAIVANAFYIAGLPSHSMLCAVLLFSLTLIPILLHSPPSSLTDDLLPRVQREFKAKFARSPSSITPTTTNTSSSSSSSTAAALASSSSSSSPPSELDAFRTKLERFHEVLRADYAQKRALQCCDAMLGWKEGKQAMKRYG